MINKNRRVVATRENNGGECLLFGYEKPGIKVILTEVLELGSPTEGGAHSLVTTLREDESKLFSSLRPELEQVYVMETGDQIFKKCIAAGLIVSDFIFTKETWAQREMRTRQGALPTAQK
jgi:hypothetical protein